MPIFRPILFQSPIHLEEEGGKILWVIGVILDENMEHMLMVMLEK